ncbi:MAG: transposase family protein [Clostridiales bacterium]|nr:transposase family protein [Clostridiales bacterium]
MKNLRYTARQKRAALKMWLEDKVFVWKVCQKFKCTERTLWRWKALFDGTLQSLENKSTRPHTPHPTAHTKEEVDTILKIFKKKPNISYNEAYGILRTKHAYSRSYGGFYNFVLRNNIRPHKELEKYIPQPYDTPEMLGIKWQMDVKYVPVECYIGEIIHYDDNKYYQYTMIDEATRERFIYPYKEHNVSSTLDFVKRAIAYFGYAPSIIQTDNGGEFTNVKKPNQKEPVKHALDVLCDKLQIKHQLIRAYTPRQNGKVERSHRSDQESFYNYLKYKTLAELKKKMMKWNITYNNRPHSSLRNREGKKVWWSPLQKRADLLEVLKEHKEEYVVRFTKTVKTIKQIYAA